MQRNHLLYFSLCLILLSLVCIPAARAGEKPPNVLLVVVDDIALPFGTLRLRTKGGDAGHNGLNHIQTILGTTSYARLKFGIGNDYYQGQQVDYVLSGWAEDQEKALPERIEMAGEIIKSFGVIGLERTMNAYNNK